MPKPRRSIVVAKCGNAGKEDTILEDALGVFARTHFTLPPPPGKRWSIRTACAEAIMSGTELVLLLAEDVHLGRSDISKLIDGYEAGARIVTGDRHSFPARSMHHFAGVMTGIRRQDFESPVRLYDSSALKEVLEHLPDSAQHPLLLMSIIEHRLRFATREVRLRTQDFPSNEKPPIEHAGDFLSALAEIWSFYPASRRIR